MEHIFKSGDITRSIAGHDADRYYVIVSTEGIYAYIANGKLRKIQKPKKKKMKHLEYAGCSYEQLTGEQFDIENISNPKLKKALSGFNG